jgi:SAM-dependent methyltransferase
VKHEVRRIWRRLPRRAKVSTYELFARGGRVFFNEPLRRLSTEYLRWFYEWDEIRRWADPRKGPPEWFDHRANLYRFSAERVPYWVERGVYGRELMFEGCRVLDLCCGDGFYAFHFYAETAAHVDAVDLDPTALAHARRWHAHPRIRYSQVDVIEDPFPNSNYDVIIWDGAIEHFTLKEQRLILDKIRDALGPHGILAGYTILGTEGELAHPRHKHEFQGRIELADVLAETFPHVATLETRYSERRNLYFRASEVPDRLCGFRMRFDGSHSQ